MSTTQATVLREQSRTETETIYNRVFWLSFSANVSLVTANALTFRFAEFVAFLGGSEGVAGAIVSTGVIGALFARLVLGQAIDSYGTRRLWILSSLIFFAGCSLFLISSNLSWTIYAGRVGFSVGLAGMFTCSMVHIQNQVPAGRRTEIIGSLGASGFIAMIIGSQLGDAIMRFIPAGRTQFLTLFGGAMFLGVLYLGIVTYLTRNDVHQRPKVTPAAHRLIFRYWPGSVVFVAIQMGIGFTVTTVFLTRFATHLGLTGIGTFFTAFSISAFFFRVRGRRWSRTIGRHRMILMGLTGQTIGLALLPLVSREWHFIIPAIGCGFGHALLFPAALSLGSGMFPRPYRGSGTTILLGFTEVGAMVSAPVLGWIIDHHGFGPMFTASAASAFSIGILYAFTGARKPDEDVIQHKRQIMADEFRDSEDEPEIESREDESISVPFPQLGRNA